MFKRGEKIVAKKDTPAHDIYKDRVLIVQHDQGGCDYCKPNDFMPNGPGVCFYTNARNTDGWLDKYFQYIPIIFKPTNEVDFLNAFQYNFKDGI